MWNYGTDTWYPGDKICWRMPSIDRTKREEERMKLPSDREHHPLRDRAILEVLNFAKAHNFLRDGLTKSFDDSKRGVYSFLRIVPGSDDELSSIERAIVAIRTAFQLNMFNTIVMLMTYGIDPSRIPGRATNPLAYENYNANAGLESLDLDPILKKRPNYAGGDRESGKLLPPVEDMSAEEAKQFSNGLLYWSAKIGLAGYSLEEHNRPWYNFINLVLGLTFRPLLLDPKMNNYFSLARFFTEDARRGAVVRRARVGDISNAYDLRNPVGSSLFVQTSAMNDMFATAGYVSEKQHGRVVGTSLSTTGPGQWVCLSLVVDLWMLITELI